jgi:hypothetical protein
MRPDDSALLVVGVALAVVAATVPVVLPEVPLPVGTEVVVLDGFPLDVLDTGADMLDRPGTLGVETPMTDLVVVGKPLRL